MHEGYLSYLTFSGPRGRRGAPSPSDLDTSSLAERPQPGELTGITGTKQLLFCQTPLDKRLTFNNKLCKPNAKDFLASKLGFKRWGKVQVISGLLGKSRNKDHQAISWPSAVYTCDGFSFLSPSSLPPLSFFLFVENYKQTRLPVLLRARRSEGNCLAHFSKESHSGWKLLPALQSEWLGSGISPRWSLTCFWGWRKMLLWTEITLLWSERWRRSGAPSKQLTEGTHWLPRWGRGCCGEPHLGWEMGADPQGLLSGWDTHLRQRCMKRSFNSHCSRPLPLLSSELSGSTLVESTWKVRGHFPALHLVHNGSPMGRSWLSVSGNYYFKRLIKMPGPKDLWPRH